MEVKALTMSRDGRRAVTCSMLRDGRRAIKVRDLETGLDLHTVASMLDPMTQGEVTCCAATGDGSIVVTCTDRGFIEVRIGMQLIPILLKFKDHYQHGYRFRPGL